MKINLLLSIILLLTPQSTIALATTNSKVDRTDSSYGTGIVNTQIHTIVEYHGQQIYIYKSLSNDPKNVIYYYVPIMFPKKKQNTSWIWTSGKGELRLNVMFGNDEIDDMARKQVIKTGENGTFEVAPLIVDSFSAFIVSANNEPVPGVYPFRKIHPNDKTMTIRFACSSEVIAQEVMSHVIDGDYDVEFAFFFAGFNKVSTSMVSITSDSLKSVFSKTIADGGNTNAIYIHRGQTNKFVSSYLANVRKIIYKENPKSNTFSLTAGLEEQLVSRMQQAMDNSKQEKLDSNMYGQVWSSSDLNPDRITSELNKIFTYNQAETEYRSTTDKYYDFNKQYANSLAKSIGINRSINILGKISENIGLSASVNKDKSGTIRKTTYDVTSLTDIKRYLDQMSIEAEWNGEKIIPKSFHVYKLTEITDSLQVSLMTIELTAEKANKAMIRTLSTLNLPQPIGELTETNLTQTNLTQTKNQSVESSTDRKDIWLVQPGVQPPLIGFFNLDTLDTVAYDLSSIIPNTTKTFSVNMFLTTGGMQHQGLVNVWLWTECATGVQYSYYKQLWWWPQAAISYDSDVLDFVYCSSNKKLYVKADRVKAAAHPTYIQLFAIRYTT